MVAVKVSWLGRRGLVVCSCEAWKLKTLMGDEARWSCSCSRQQLLCASVLVHFGSHHYSWSPGHDLLAAAPRFFLRYEIYVRICEVQEQQFVYSLSYKSFMYQLINYMQFLYSRVSQCQITDVSFLLVSFFVSYLISFSRLCSSYIRTRACLLNTQIHSHTKYSLSVSSIAMLDFTIVDLSVCA